ncbi:peptidoglycan-binding domain-containing protein [Streptomyces sp. CSDS2]|uniref:peptidoglycan-binding protein n=1 Tax=Streptomyces sp. CSDS2 TaxID=3055051 RepID=UPI0025B03F3A|nr:peptidoglycan-binding domain-containing protein [Streptomyces sp. CSDS2]MDN3265255.1 peptidoglycan-binding domain-containing protein [Streptomyces sp. CSDS2]
MTETVTHIDDDPRRAPTPPRGRRGRRTALIACAVVVVAAVAVVGALGLGGGDDGDPSAPPRSGSVVSVTRATLTERTSLEGQLGYGTELPLPVKAQGTVTWLPETGATVERGDELLRVDDRPVILMYGSLPMYRPLGLTAQENEQGPDDQNPENQRQNDGGGAGESPNPSRSQAPRGPGSSQAPRELKGMDVMQFEANLAALGYTGFTVDEKFTDLTAAAVKRWQKSLGVAQTGTVDVGDVIYSASEVRIGRPGTRLGSAVGENTLTYTGTTRKVTVNASATEASWAVRGARVTVRLPNGNSVQGKVAAIGRQATAPEGGGGEGGGTARPATIPVTVTIEDQRAVGRLESGPVTVEYVGEEARDVLTVPVSALVALAEGGHGLETADGRFVAVQTGMFADGKVEVRGAAVREGMKVRIPE